jgi:hypothetical protein
MPIRNYGLSWDRKTAELVGLWGKRRGEPAVYFASQIGIYTLEMNGKIVYVGQTGTGKGASLNKRLVYHVTHKKRKWDSFSWFGIRPARRTGTLVKTPKIKMDTGTLIQDIETLLIALLEPPMNLKAGKYKHMRSYRQCMKVQR